jgi:TolB protein
VVESDSVDGDPDVAPDGQSLIFTRLKSGVTGLRILQLSNGSITALPGQGLGQFRPEWSPDGGKVAYMVAEAQSLLIWVVDADGGNPHAVTSAPGFDSDPTWSPDGNWILYAHSGALFRVSPAGGTPVPVPCSGGCIQPVYSPDGQSILYTGNTSGPPANQDIYRMDADGGNVDTLTNAPDNEQAAVWSPDGTSIVFTRISSGTNLRLFRLDLDGSDPVDISNGHFDQAPDWGPAAAP